MTKDLTKPRVLSGIQASGRLHIGNYIGAVSLWAENQAQYENFLFVADLHALTVPESVDPKILRARVEEVFALYLACGIDPEQSTLFVQSEVPQHAELGWLLTCATPVSWLERATQYKVKGSSENASAGLLCYPSLQAADILLYDADAVPVGDDQRQHVEITRSIGRRFNSLFGKILKIPELLVRASGSRIMGLDDATAKMSKSTAEKQSGHAIGLLDTPSQARKKIMRAQTDSGSAVDFTSDLGPGVENLLVMYEALTGSNRGQSVTIFDGVQYGNLKKQVAEVVIETLEGIQRSYKEIVDDRARLDKLLTLGSERARQVAAAKLAQCYEAVGLRR
ncbi:MAG: tryptophan--tRNA ligase [Pseudonocardiaceae bacterium]